ncbi:hypothetical protein SPOG_03930 [Schizosaccharomyces cryophilus OY26]|uniref:Uncharacterized protein n=1 Tax=Schizosaccharomyces cryophilus (strain OY26 / ATCC MYA-4695 / CBS 11777 / NBRC 106824 / NRRL Y48691) TaxID=653667 RepID=S9W6F1_SCHCR|nr:uncharacterized protein SPOG_03930 [Schizosaccharomyces cryophilus OY26]EPY53405.1 hypothetical protein SPOG_03930 [Schizosaccharomyces cryophilus OY26]
MKQATTVFRSILREMRQMNGIYRSAKGLTSTQRTAIESLKTWFRNGSSDDLKKSKELLSLIDSGNKHELIFQQYHPLVGLSELDKAKLAANRVGLDF